MRGVHPIWGIGNVNAGTISRQCAKNIFFIRWPRVRYVPTHIWIFDPTRPISSPRLLARALLGGSIWLLELAVIVP